MKIRTLIIDDNEKARVALKSDIEDYCPTIDVINEANGVQSAFKTIIKDKPELIFLDIQMADGTGFDLLEKLQNASASIPKIIFTTAYDQYAINAFKYAALDYLLKPVSADELIRSVNRIKEQTPKQSFDPNNRLAISEKDRIHLLNHKDIIYLEAEKNYTTIYSTDEKKIIASKNLKHFEEKLQNSSFIRVHHAYLVNVEHIIEFVKTEGNHIILDNKIQLPVSVRKKDEVIARLKNE